MVARSKPWKRGAGANTDPKIQLMRRGTTLALFGRSVTSKKREATRQPSMPPLKCLEEKAEDT